MIKYQIYGTRSNQITSHQNFSQRLFAESKWAEVCNKEISIWCNPSGLRETLLKPIISLNYYNLKCSCPATKRKKPYFVKCTSAKGTKYTPWLKSSQMTQGVIVTVHKATDKQACIEEPCVCEHGICCRHSGCAAHAHGKWPWRTKASAHNKWEIFMLQWCCHTYQHLNSASSLV